MRAAAVVALVSLPLALGLVDPVHVTVASPPTAPEEARLNLASLETRLRTTKAIGIFTKLSLKNQIDDLLQEITAFHRGGSPDRATLREKYDLLLLKVLSLLQRDDAALASA